MSKLVQSPPCGRLAAKIDAIEKGLDEVPDLANRMDEGQPTTPAVRALIRALEDYLPGLYTNPASNQKAAVFLADSRVCRVLSVLHGNECKSRCEWYAFNEIRTLLEMALGDLLEVYQAEETRARVYARKGEPRPNMKKPPKLDARPLSGKKSP